MVEIVHVMLGSSLTTGGVAEMVTVALIPTESVVAGNVASADQCYPLLTREVALSSGIVVVVVVVVDAVVAEKAVYERRETVVRTRTEIAVGIAESSFDYCCYLMWKVVPLNYCLFLVLMLVTLDSNLLAPEVTCPLNCLPSLV